MKWAQFHECGNKKAATQYLLNNAAKKFQQYCHKLCDWIAIVIISEFYFMCKDDS